MTHEELLEDYAKVRGTMSQNQEDQVICLCGEVGIHWIIQTTQGWKCVFEAIPQLKRKKENNG